MPGRFSLFLARRNASVGCSLPSPLLCVDGGADDAPLRKNSAKRILFHPKLDDADRAEFLSTSLMPRKPNTHTGWVKSSAKVGESVRRFEASHPQFTETADKILNYLSRMEI